MQETWETQVQSPGWEDPLEEGTATHSSILTWEAPWTEEPGGATVHEVEKSQTWISDKTTTIWSIISIAEEVSIF